MLLMGKGPYSFVGTKVFETGTFDRIRIEQGARTFVLQRAPKQYQYLPFVSAKGAPQFDEIGLFRIPAQSGTRCSRAVAAGNSSGRRLRFWRANARVQAQLHLALAIRTATGRAVCPGAARCALARELARTGAQHCRAWLWSTGAHSAAHRDAQADAPRASLSGVAHWLSTLHAGVDRLDRGSPAKHHQRFCVVGRAHPWQRLGRAPRRPVAVRVAGVRGRKLRHLGPWRVLRLAVPVRRPTGAPGQARPRRQVAPVVAVVPGSSYVVALEVRVARGAGPRRPARTADHGGRG